MATDAVGTTVPAGSDEFDPQGDMVDMAASMWGMLVIPVANTTARSTVGASLDAAGVTACIFNRADATDGQNLEICLDTSDPSTVFPVDGRSPSDWTIITAASGYTSTAYSRLFYVGGKSFLELAGYITINAGSLVRATTIGTITSTHRPTTTRRPAATVGNGSTTATGTGAIISSTGTIQLTSDNTTLGAHTVAYLDGIRLPIEDYTP